MVSACICYLCRLFCGGVKELLAYLCYHCHLFGCGCILHICLINVSSSTFLDQVWA